MGAKFRGDKLYRGANATTNIPIAMIGRRVNKVKCVRTLTTVTPTKAFQAIIKNTPVVKTKLQPAKILILNTPLLN